MKVPSINQNPSTAPSKTHTLKRYIYERSKFKTHIKHHKIAFVSKQNAQKHNNKNVISEYLAKQNKRTHNLPSHHAMSSNVICAQSMLLLLLLFSYKYTQT